MSTPYLYTTKDARPQSNGKGTFRLAVPFIRNPNYSSKKKRKIEWATSTNSKFRPERMQNTFNSKEEAMKNAEAFDFRGHVERVLGANRTLHFFAEPASRVVENFERARRLRERRKQESFLQRNVSLCRAKKEREEKRQRLIEEWNLWRDALIRKLSEHIQSNRLLAH